MPVTQQNRREIISDIEVFKTTIQSRIAELTRPLDRGGLFQMMDAVKDSEKFDPEILERIKCMQNLVDGFDTYLDSISIDFGSPNTEFFKVKDLVDIFGKGQIEKFRELETITIRDKQFVLIGRLRSDLRYYVRWDSSGNRLTVDNGENFADTAMLDIKKYLYIRLLPSGIRYGVSIGNDGLHLQRVSDIKRDHHDINVIRNDR